MPVLAICRLIQSFCLQYVILNLTSYTFMEFYLGIDISNDTVLTKELLLVSKSFAVLNVIAAIFS